MPDFGPAGPCPICRTYGASLASHAHRDAYHLLCGNCGEHIICGSALAQLRADMATVEQVALRAHAVFKIKADVVISVDQLERLATTGKLPDAGECIDNLVLLLADASSPGTYVPMRLHTMKAAIGVAYEHAAQWVIDEALGMGLLERTIHDQAQDEFDAVYRLKLAGWTHRDKLLKNGHGSSHAFMAMDFNEADIRDFFSQHLQGAVRQTDFELRTTDHPGKTAGLIDNRMRVDLRTSRFVVCDLTHGNRGAYWEAGFAEGIGRPVFYICQRKVLADRTHKDHPHFDAAHQPIVAWDPTDPAPSLAELKAMIRATLPAEARMEDPAGDAGARPGQP